MIVWATAVLCVDSNLEEFESNIQDWVRQVGGCEKWRLLAKEVIAGKLRYGLREIELHTDAVDVLNLLASIEPLKHAAVFMTIHLLCNDLSVSPGDHWAMKAEMYYRKFQDEWPVALGMIHVDRDESGSISYGEKYNVPGIRFVRGR